jgi:hypothetical protein
MTVRKFGTLSKICRDICELGWGDWCQWQERSNQVSVIYSNFSNIELLPLAWCWPTVFVFDGLFQGIDKQPIFPKLPHLRQASLVTTTMAMTMTKTSYWCQWRRRDDDIDKAFGDSSGAIGALAGFVITGDACLFGRKHNERYNSLLLNT